MKETEIGEIKIQSRYLFDFSDKMVATKAMMCNEMKQF